MVEMKLRKQAHPKRIFRNALHGYNLMKGEENNVREIVVREVVQKEETVKKIPEEKPAIPEGIPLFERATVLPIPPQPEIDLTKIDISYSLIPRKSNNPFAIARIKWSPAEAALVYDVVEPELSNEEK